jgi:cation diffusion facilitator CzcD-associated flavoprotein CzcO
MRAGPDVVVIGGGPSGLACAAELTARGVSAAVLERGAGVGAAWEGRYDRLRLNTGRLNSALPGARFPRDFGQFPTRDQYVDYLRTYARDRGVRVESGVTVAEVKPDDGGGWRLRTGSDERHADHVIVATGMFDRPAVPDWPGREVFQGDLLHAARYRNPEPFEGRDVLVVGAGSTGFEIAHDLVRGGAAGVRLSVRTSPHVLPRLVGGLPADLPLPLLLRLPTTWADRLLAAVERTVVGDLTAFGLPAPTEGAIAQLLRRGAGTAIVDREVIDAVRAGAIQVVPAVERLEEDGAVLVGGGRVPADVIIAATGYRTGLADLVGRLDVLDDRGIPVDGNGGEVAPGLRFVGFVHRPGLTGYVGRTARRVAREIAADRQLTAARGLIRPNSRS